MPVGNLCDAVGYPLVNKRMRLCEVAYMSRVYADILIFYVSATCLSSVPFACFSTHKVRCSGGVG